MIALARPEPSPDRRPCDLCGTLDGYTRPHNHHPIRYAITRERAGRDGLACHSCYHRLGLNRPLCRTPDLTPPEDELRAIAERIAKVRAQHLKDLRDSPGPNFKPSRRKRCPIERLARRMRREAEGRTMYILNGG